MIFHTPRLLKARDAATYCGLSRDQFQSMVSAGMLPQRLPGTHMYDRKAIDKFLDRLSGLTSEGNDEAPK